MRLKKGMVHVYTGNGKGKTTAALGLAFRAAGHNLRIYMIQFMKGNINYGELKSARRLSPRFYIKQVGRETFVDFENPDPEDKRLAKEGFMLAKQIVKEGKFDIVILDEINVAVYFKLIPVEDLIELINKKPEHVELILTGRYAHEKIIEAADLVTEMREVKHYFTRGIKSREGIEI